MLPRIGLTAVTILRVLLLTVAVTGICNLISLMVKLLDNL